MTSSRPSPTPPETTVGAAEQGQGQGQGHQVAPSAPLLPRLWSLTRSACADRYTLGIQTESGTRVEIQLRPADILGMASAVIDDLGENSAFSAHPAPLQ